MTEENSQSDSKLLQAGLSPVADAHKLPKVRNAEVSKKSILVAAKDAFSVRGYDEVGLREIAQAAQIDPALIIRYFGSKEGLFREVLAQHLCVGDLIKTEENDYAVRLAKVVMGQGDPLTEKALLLLSRSQASEIAGPLVREAIENKLMAPLIQKLSTLPGMTFPEIRVPLLIALLTGMSEARNVARYSTFHGPQQTLSITLLVKIITDVLFTEFESKN